MVPSQKATYSFSLEKNDFQYVLGVAINEAEKALDETVNQNPVLEKAGVVDAGGMGWLVVMKAMYQTLKNGEIASYHPLECAEPKEKAAETKKPEAKKTDEYGISVPEKTESKTQNKEQGRGR